MATKELHSAQFLELVTDIVCAYISKNTVVASDMPKLVASVSAALESAQSHSASDRNAKQEPAVQAKNSITPDYLVCLEDGKKYKSLRQHLRTQYELSPEAYREKWKLPHDYPMVAPNYAKARSALAKKMKLGQFKKK